MRYNRLLPAILFALCFAVAAQAQQSQVCTLNVEQAPEIRGFRLGMTMGQVNSRLPNIQLRRGQFGRTTATLDASELSEAGITGLESVGRINLDFVDEHLTSFTIFYSNSIRWNNAQFAARVADALRLPAAWQNDSTMECNGFKIIVYPNSITMTMTQPYKIVQQRQAEQEERERQSFRP